MIDAIDLLKERARASFVGDIEGDGARPAAEFGLSSLQAFARSSSHDDASTFRLGALCRCETDTGGAAQNYDRLMC